MRQTSERECLSKSAREGMRPESEREGMCMCKYVCVTERARVRE